MALALKGAGHVHSDKWHRCWTEVQGKGKSSDSAAAICTSSIGYQGSVNKEYRTPGKPPSDKPKKKVKKSYAEMLRADHAIY